MNNGLLSQAATLFISHYLFRLFFSQRSGDVHAVDAQSG